MNDYEWDAAKRRENADKHTVDFAEIYAFDWDTAMYNSNDTHGERRLVVTGYIGMRRHTVVYTWRDSRKRIISLRKASPREMRDYAQT